MVKMFRNCSNNLHIRSEQNLSREKHEMRLNIYLTHWNTRLIKCFTLWSHSRLCLQSSNSHSKRHVRNPTVHWWVWLCLYVLTLRLRHIHIITSKADQCSFDFICAESNVNGLLQFIWLQATIQGFGLAIGSKLGAEYQTTNPIIIYNTTLIMLMITYRLFTHTHTCHKEVITGRTNRTKKASYHFFDWTQQGIRPHFVLPLRAYCTLVKEERWMFICLASEGTKCQGLYSLKSHMPFLHQFFLPSFLFSHLLIPPSSPISSSEIKSKQRGGSKSHQ